MLSRPLECKLWANLCEKLQPVPTHNLYIYIYIAIKLSEQRRYLFKFTGQIKANLQSLQKTIRYMLTPAATGCPAFSDNERDVLLLPARMKGLDISTPYKIAQEEERNSCVSTAPLVQAVWSRTEHMYIHIWVVLYTHCLVGQCWSPTSAECKCHELQDQHQCKLEWEEETTCNHNHHWLDQDQHSTYNNALINAR